MNPRNGASAGGKDLGDIAPGTFPPPNVPPLLPPPGLPPLAAHRDPPPPSNSIRGYKGSLTKFHTNIQEVFDQITPHLTNITFPDSKEQIPSDEELKEEMAATVDKEITTIESLLLLLDGSVVKFKNAHTRLVEIARHPDLARAEADSIFAALATTPYDKVCAESQSMKDQLKVLHDIYWKGLQELRPADESFGIAPSRQNSASREASPAPQAVVQIFPSIPRTNANRAVIGSSLSDPGTIANPLAVQPAANSFSFVHSLHSKIDSGFARMETITSTMEHGFVRMESALIEGLEKGFDKLAITLYQPAPTHVRVPSPIRVRDTVFSMPTDNRVSRNDDRFRANLPHTAAVEHANSFVSSHPARNSDSTAHFPSAIAPTSNFTNVNGTRSAKYEVPASQSLFNRGQKYHNPNPIPSREPRRSDRESSPTHRRYDRESSPAHPSSLPQATDLDSPHRDSHSFSNNNRSRLPEIKLATFDGDPKEWRNFKSTFEVVVHTRDIPSIEKMLHLRNCLQGEALSSISMFENEDYDQAWDQVKEVFGHRQHLTDRLVRELETVPKSSPSPHAQKQTLNSIRGLISMLPDCEQSSNPVLHSLVFNKFSPLIQEKIVEKKTTDKTSDKWSLNKLFGLITDEISLLERKQELLGPAFPVSSIYSMQTPDYHPPKPTRAPSRSPSPRPLPCTFCKSSNHRAKDCPRTPSLQARKDFIEKHGLCYNCRSDSHISRECSKGPCHSCQRFHDVSICPAYHSWNRDNYRTRTPSRTRFSDYAPQRGRSRERDSLARGRSRERDSLARGRSRESDSLARGRSRERDSFSRGRSHERDPPSGRNPRPRTPSNPRSNSQTRYNSHERGRYRSQERRGDTRPFQSSRSDSSNREQ